MKHFVAKIHDLM